VPQQLGDLHLLQQPDASPLPIDDQIVVDHQSSTAHFNYHDINVMSIEGIIPHLKINSSLPLFQLNPQLKNVVRNAVNQTVMELVGPVSERAIKVAITATEHLCRKVGDELSIG
jgi:hypothetical protein